MSIGWIGILLATFGTLVNASQEWPRVRIEVVGAPEIVLSSPADSCRDPLGLDVPDVPVRAVRRPGDEAIILFVGNAPRYYVLVGQDFQSLHKDCLQPVLISGDSWYAHTFDNQEWIIAVYREGRVIHALVHNEYHDPFAPNCKLGVTDPSNPCWYNAITYAVSWDGGKTFFSPPPPQHVVAAVPIPWDPTPTQSCRRACPPPPYGYFGSSNIVRGPDGYYYALFMSIPNPAKAEERGTCVMRTRNLNDPRSWRAWDGNGFDLPMPVPYDEQGNPRPTGLPPCTPVSPREIGTMHESLTFNSYLGLYLLVGSGVFNVEGRLVCGIFFSLSADLIHWSPAQLFMEAKLPFGPCNPEGTVSGSIVYPSLIDHTSSSPNFEITGATPYLYFVHLQSVSERNLMRVPIRIERAP